MGVPLVSVLCEYFPHDVAKVIKSYIPRGKKQGPPSPSLGLALYKLQTSPKSRKKNTAMYLYGLDDFVLN